MKSILVSLVLVIGCAHHVAHAMDAFPGTFVMQQGPINNHELDKDGAMFFGPASASRRLKHLRSSERKLQGPVRLDEIVAQTWPLRTLEAYLTFGLVVSDIQVDGPVAMFMPWDDGWDRFDPTWSAKLRTRPWTAHLQDLLHYHMYDEGLPLEDLGESQVLEMKNGGSVTVERRPGTNRLKANDIDVIANVYEATNGYVPHYSYATFGWMIHLDLPNIPLCHRLTKPDFFVYCIYVRQGYMLDDVLIPAWLRDSTTLWDIIESFVPAPVVSFIEENGVDEGLSDPDASLTMFAPTTQAWLSLGAEALEYLVSEEGQPFLLDILLYHAVPNGPHPSITFRPGALPTPLEGEQIEILNPSDTPVTVAGNENTAQIVQADVVAING